MSKFAVIYKSKYGSAKKYAEWITEAINADSGINAKVDVIKHSEVRINELSAYDTIIYGGGLFASSLEGFSLIKKNLKVLADKRMIVFAVGSAYPTIDNVEKYMTKNIPAEYLGKVDFYMFRGRMDYTTLKFFDRMLMSLIVKMLKRQKPDKISEDARELIACYGKTTDFTDKSAIKPLIDSLKGEKP